MRWHRRACLAQLIKSLALCGIVVMASNSDVDKRCFAASKGRTVAIIGAGPSGLAACKATKEEGLQPVVFEKAGNLGGLWRSDKTGKVWKSLCTNLSKYTCAFSDKPHDAATPDFPNGAQVQAYLEAYAEEHGLSQHIKFNSPVINVDLVDAAAGPLDEGGGSSGWQVTWTRQNTTEDGPVSTKLVDTFDHVIVASGIFEVPYIPDLPGDAGFTAKSLHAAEYKEPGPFAGKSVLVVGAAFSGADIAAELAGSARSVTVTATNPHWYIPRFIGGKPLDLAFYSRAASARSATQTEEERNLKRHNFFGSFAGPDGQLPSPLETPDPKNGTAPNFVAISDVFLDAVRSNDVRVRTARVQGFDKELVLFSDGTKEAFDVVIWATGYRLDLPFLSSALKELIEFDGQDQLQPVILHECVWHPKLTNLAFVGLYRGPYFAGMELQARWAAGVFSGRLEHPSPAEMEEGLEKERQIREKSPRPQFPHGDYTGMVEALARHAGVHPAEAMEKSDEMRHLLTNGPLLPFHYRLVGFAASPEAAMAAIKECDQNYPTPVST